MARYVDGYVIAVPKRKVEAYRRVAQRAGKVWREHGALEFRECVAEDLKVAGGLISFTRLIKARPGETVMFSWVLYKSRAHRDKVNKKVLNDPRIAKLDPKDMPFDMKRMAFGGFEVLVDE